MRALRGVRSAAVYDGPIERAIKRLKYDGWRALVGTLGEMLARAAPAESDGGGEVVVAVPLHWRRAWQRGYNQAELLAAELRRRTGRGRAAGRLVRIRNTRTQVGLDRIQRRRNVHAAFAWRGRALTGRTVLLVDDVTTTGATLEACAAALRAAGAARVSAVTVARALH